MVRALIVDDSPTARQLLFSILNSDPEIEVVGQACSGREGIRLAESMRPDVVTMDILMPGMDGFEASKELMTCSPVPIVVVTAGTSGSEADTAMKALEAGALAVLQKLGGPGTPDFESARRAFVRTIKAMAGVRVIRRRSLRSRASRPEADRLGSERGGTSAPRIVAIAASTGGPNAVHALLSRLSPEFPLPLLLVQHISRGFAERFAQWLDSTSPVRVKLAVDHEVLQAGTLYVAPDTQHLLVANGGTVALSDEPPVGGFRPAATCLFSSVAKTYGPGTVAVVLSGMGCDGVEGLKQVRNAGGVIMAQSEQTSIVFGMPGAAIEAGLAKAGHSPDEIGSRIQNLAKRKF